MAAASPSCDKPAPITFSPGASERSETGAVARGELACWMVAAKAGQTMTLRLESREKTAVMQVYEPGWRVRRQDGDLTFQAKALPGAGEEDDATGWTGKLPASGPFLVVVGATRGGSDYTLRVEVGGSP